MTAFVARLGLLALLFDPSPIFVMGADPDPDEVRTILDCEGTVIDANPRGPEVSYFLKVQRGVRGISFQ